MVQLTHKLTSFARDEPNDQPPAGTLIPRSPVQPAARPSKIIKSRRSPHGCRNHRGFALIRPCDIRNCVKTGGVRISQWSLTRIRNGFTKRLARVALPRMLPITAGELPLTLVGSAEDARMVPVGLLDERFVCYCVGVGDSVTFDLDLVERGCRVFAFDPTPESIEYMKTIEYDEDRLTFEPYGVWSENTTRRFYAPAANAKVNWSVVDLHSTGEYFTAECKTLSTIMAEHGHDRIDLLKLDVEGAWEPILESMLRDGIRPRILVVEFDSPTSIRKVRRMVARLDKAGFALAHFKAEDFLFVERG
jgi:FkbM family methyltransferase